jgi:hypothetical protein
MASKKESVIELRDMVPKPPAIESRFATAATQTKADNANLTIDGSKRYTLQTLIELYVTHDITTTQPASSRQ